MKNKSTIGMLGICTLIAVAVLTPNAIALQNESNLGRPVYLHEIVLNQTKAEVKAQKLVGISVGVIRGGQLHYLKSFGHEDHEHNIPSSNATMYRWASISKPLTAIVAMKLADQGKLDLDADIRTYVPEFPDKGVTITSRQLLAHQGGIVHYTNGPVIKTERTYDIEHPFADTILALDDFKESPLVNQPGEKYAYTTRGYMLLGAVIQRAGNKPYTQLVDELVATPSNMTTLRPDYQWLDIPNSAVGYRLRGRGDDARSIPSTDTDVSWKLPGGGYISTITDLANFAIALLGDELLTEDQKEQMWTRQVTTDGSQTGYGLGFFCNGQTGEHLRVNHSGSQEKTKTYLLISPYHNAGVVIMCNSEQARLGAFANELLDAVIRWSSTPIDDTPPSADPAQLLTATNAR